MNNPASITMADKRTFRVGQRVTFRRGSSGIATIARINVPKRGCVMFVLKDIEFTTPIAPLDGWPLATGGFYNCYTSEGVSGGCLVTETK